MNQTVSELFQHAMWITPKENTQAASPSIQTAYFRLLFPLDGPASLTLHISASSRYRLWVNGKHVTYGPCKGDRWRHYYESVDVTPWLKAGMNVLAVKVVAYPPYEAQRGESRGPYWTMAKALGPSLMVAGECMMDNGASSSITTGRASWEALHDNAVQWRLFRQTHWMGSMESVDGSLLPHGWRDGDGLNPGWEAAQQLWSAEDRGLSMFGIIPVFPLTPRPIPLPFERDECFLREMPLRAGDYAPLSFQGLSGNVIPPHTRAAVELDAGELTTGFLRLPVTGGMGSRITIRYAESYSEAEGRIVRKGQRDDWENYRLIGHEDEYRPSGGADVYEPFWFRTFRFIRIEVETGAEGLTLDRPCYTETGYPLETHSTVTASEQWVGQLWDISVRTLKRCMHETYEDCPYYEQLQYIQDTRLEALFTYMASGDTRLAARAIEDFHCSLLPNGMLQARYPTQEPLIIPPFSLHWISMVLEYYWQTGDASVPRRYRPTVDAVLDYYDRKVGSYGLVEGLGYWDQIDWVDQWHSIAGRTPASAVGPATTHNLMYVVALQAAAELTRATGREGVAAEYEERAKQILCNVQRHCWSESEGLYLEGPGYEEYSQHAQVYAVLAGLAEGEQARGILQRALSRPGIAKCSFTQQFFLFRALEKCDAYELTEQQWDLWKPLPGKNLTTIPETPDGASSPRSDCHAWGALPLYEFPRCILGVSPAQPGWERIVIQPRTLSLSSASGTVTTPKGLVSVAWRQDAGGLQIDVETPKGVPAVLILPDGVCREIVS